MLQFQIAQAAFRFGLAEGVDPHQVPFGTLMTAENCVWRKGGRIEKRYGSAALTRNIIGGGTIAAGARLLVRGSELVVIDGANLYSYSALGGGWTNTGTVPELGVTWSTLVDSMAGVRSSDLGVLSDGRIVQAWVTGDPVVAATTGGVFFQVFDRASGSRSTTIQAVAGAAITNANMVRVVVSGATFVIVWSDAAGKIRCSVNGAAPVDLRTDAVASSAFDAYVIGTNFVVAYEYTGANPKVRLYSYSFASPPVQQATGSVTGETRSAFQSISICGKTGETLYIGYLVNNVGAIFAAADPTTLAQTTAPVVLDAGGGSTGAGNIGLERLDATHCLFAYNFDATSYPENAVVTSVVSSAGAITAGATRKTFGTLLLSRPFLMNGVFYAYVMDTTDTSSGSLGTAGWNSYLVGIETNALSTGTWHHRYVGRVDVLLASSFRPGSVCNVPAVSATETLTSLPFQATALQTVATVGGWRTGAHLVSATLGASQPKDLFRGVQLDQELVIAAGVLQTYDGRQAYDYGFSNPALVDPGQTTHPAGGLLAAGTYIYQPAPEFRTATGMLFRGPPSVQFSITVALNDKVSLAILPPPFSSKQSSAQGAAGSSPLSPDFIVYRTVVAGTNPQRLTVEPTYNVATSGYQTSPVTFVDTRADGNVGNGQALGSRPGLYTIGGELGDFQPPASVTVCLHRNRLFSLAGDQKTWWLTKDYAGNVGTAPGFYPTQVFQFSEQQVGALSMDEKLVFYAAGSIWYLNGDGPDAKGLQSDYGSPNRIQTDVGCTNGRSLVATPDGHMFVSARGIYLLTRGLEAVWIGRPVQDELAAFPNVTSAVLVAARNEIRFTANNAAGTAGIVLVYNYVEKQWSTARYTVNGVYGAPIADAVVWNGAWTFVTPSGFVVSEDVTTYLDGATWVPLTIETAWCSGAGPLSFQSVRSFQLEGIANTNHDLTISAGFDSDPSYPQTRTFAAGSPVTSIGPLEQCEITIGTRRKCQHIRFKIQDATPSGGPAPGTGQGPSFDTMGLEVGIKKGFAVNPATKKG